MSTFSVDPNERVAIRKVWEDADLIVVIKPAGLVTQPGLGHERDSLLNGLFARHGAALQQLGAARDYGLLHRLDRETSGLLVVALRPAAYDHLRKAFESRSVGKYYWTVVFGSPRAASGVLRKPINEVQARPEGREGTRAPAMKLARISRTGKPAVTAYRVLSSKRGASLIECRTLTGRLHQVRVHLESIGCPVLGDSLYAPKAVRSLSPRLALHAHRLVIPLPDRTRLDCRTAWPNDLRGPLKRFDLEKPAGVNGASVLAAAVKGSEELDDDGVGDDHSGVGE